MFDWLFRASCPCDHHSKQWVEDRLRWLAREFPENAFAAGDSHRKTVVLPTSEFFPDPYNASPDSASVLLDRVCQYMGVPSRKVVLEFFTNRGRMGMVNERGQDLGHKAGTYEEFGGKFYIRIDEMSLANPMDLVGTFAHELSHARLLGERRIFPHEFDNELLTDLTAVHLGMGIFLANSPRAWASDFTIWPETDAPKPEYMTLSMYGWALAHLAWFFPEQTPRWMRFLNMSARANLKQGLRYLRKTGDSSYHPRLIQLFAAE